ncbi:MAG: hypothetical protein ACREE6_13775, partial [Limisphaerales bacterium]
MQKTSQLGRLLGAIPHRLQLAGGWIDQPFISKKNPEPPGSMVVVQIEPSFRPMDRSGIASGTRSVATKLWNGNVPDRPREELVRELYHRENKGPSQPSGSQDMIGLIYPGVNRLDYDFNHEGGLFPVHIESCNNPKAARWLERVLHLLPIEPRPEGYNPLTVKNLDRKWICRLGQSGRDCYDAILKMNVRALGASLNATMQCWAALLPTVVRHPKIKLDLKAWLAAYQEQYPGAMYSGCGGGYLIVVSNRPVPGSIKVNVRIAK